MDLKTRYRIGQVVICQLDGMGFDRGEVKRLNLRMLEDGTQLETYIISTKFYYPEKKGGKLIPYDREITHDRDTLDLFFTLYQQCEKELVIDPEEPAITQKKKEAQILWDMRRAYDKHKEAIENANKNTRPWENRGQDSNTSADREA
jgi:hypothetical protein